MEIQRTAIIVYKIDGKIIITGVGLDIPIEIKDNEQYLFLGKLKFEPEHVFSDYEGLGGFTPNDLLNGEGLKHTNYKKVEVIF